MNTPRRSMRKIRRRTHSRWLLFLLLIAVPLFYFGRRCYTLARSLHEEKTLKEKITITEAENEVLMGRINEYKRGNFVEVKARDDLGMIRKGEKVYFIIRR